MNVIRNGQKTSMSYDEICEALGGYIPSVHFVTVTTRGTISYSAGKLGEIKDLLSNVRQAGFVPSRALEKAATQI